MAQQAQEQRTGKRRKLMRSGWSLAISAVVVLGLLMPMSGTAQAADRHVVIYNHTSYDMEGLYASNGGWEEDVLGDTILGPGDSMRVNIDDGLAHCRYDLKAVFSDGGALRERNFDVCSAGSLTIYE